MRFIHGPVPEDPQFQPLEEGWNAIREPDPVRMQFVALPVMAAAGVLVWAAVRYGTVIQPQAMMKWFLPAFVVMIPIHELIHAFASPAFGMSARTFVGVWPSKLLFYAHYEGELPRQRFLFVLAAPTLVLTVIPLLLAAALRLDAPFLATIAFTNALGAAGDLLGIGIVLRQIPRGALVRNKGWRSYWRMP
ncbi:MAG TPA: DUF3267 domain-containing protein [Thermoanaerobaculia bacterium]|nr:DUF3267 domain-containing protein [Thermoanaerobaculia bacterium]